MLRPLNQQVHPPAIKPGRLHQVIGCNSILKSYNTGWPKSNVSKVRAYCSASDHLIRKTLTGVCREIPWFEEYLEIIDIDVYFFE